MGNPNRTRKPTDLQNWILGGIGLTVLATIAILSLWPSQPSVSDGITEIELESAGTLPLPDGDSEGFWFKRYPEGRDVQDGVYLVLALADTSASMPNFSTAQLQLPTAYRYQIRTRGRGLASERDLHEVYRVALERMPDPDDPYSTTTLVFALNTKQLIPDDELILQIPNFDPMPIDTGDLLAARRQ